MSNKMQIIGLQGVNASGKSTLAHMVSRDYVEFDTVATDNLLAINRMINPDDPRLSYSSYSSWKRFGSPTMDNIWKGFNEYREANRDFLDCILRRARDQKVGMIIEGLHIDPKLFYSYQNDLDVTIILLRVSDEEKHKKRIKEKCDYRPELLVKLEEYFPYIRDIQRLLEEEARSFGIETVETGVDIAMSLEDIRLRLK
jgi:2-phosphoglycerate kinase